MNLSYSRIHFEQDSLGIQGFLLILCVIGLFIAVYFPILSIGIRGVSELNLLIFLLFLLAISQVVIKRKSACIHGFDYIILAYIFYCCLSVIYSCYSNGYSYVLELSLFKNRLMNHFILYFLLKNAIGNTRQARALITTLIIVLVLLSAFGLLSYFFGVDSFVHKASRAQSIFGCPNTFAKFILITSPFLLLVVQPRKPINKSIKVLSIILVMLALLITGSRAAFLGQCVILSLVFLGVKQKSRVIVGGIVAFVMLFSLLNFTILGEKTVFTRLRYIEERDLDNYSGGRLPAWKGSLKVYFKRPVLGYGFNSFSRAYGDKYLGIPFAPHNQYLESLFTLGIIGFSLFVLIYYKIWAFLKKNDDLIVAKACRYGITGYFVAITFSNLSNTRYTLWVALAVVLRLIDLVKHETDNVNIVEQSSTAY